MTTFLIALCVFHFMAINGKQQTNANFLSPSQSKIKYWVVVGHFYTFFLYEIWWNIRYLYLTIWRRYTWAKLGIDPYIENSCTSSVKWWVCELFAYRNQIQYSQSKSIAQSKRKWRRSENKSSEKKTMQAVSIISSIK